MMRTIFIRLKTGKILEVEIAENANIADLKKLVALQIPGNFVLIANGQMLLDDKDRLSDLEIFKMAQIHLMMK